MYKRLYEGKEFFDIGRYILEINTKRTNNSTWAYVYIMKNNTGKNLNLFLINDPLVINVNTGEFLYDFDVRYSGFHTKNDSLLIFDDHFAVVRSNKKSRLIKYELNDDEKKDILEIVREYICENIIIG